MSKKYDVATFRLVKHGIEDEDAFCRHCDWSNFGKTVTNSARYHARTMVHTVDVYRQQHIEFTSYVSEKQRKKLER